MVFIFVITISWCKESTYFAEIQLFPILIIYISISKTYTKGNYQSLHLYYFA